MIKVKTCNSWVLNLTFSFELKAIRFCLFCCFVLFAGFIDLPCLRAVIKTPPDKILKLDTISVWTGVFTREFRFVT